MKRKVYVYIGSNLREKNVKLATFDTMDEADEFVMTVVKAMNMKHSYIRKTKQSDTCYWYDYGAGHRKASTTSDFHSHFLKNSDIHVSEITNKIFE